MIQKKHKAKKNTSRPSSTEQKRVLVMTAINTFLVKADTPVTLALFKLFNAAVSGDKDALQQIRKYELKPHLYLEDKVSEFTYDYQALKLVKTFPAYKNISERDRKLAAFEKFIDSERTCRRINDICSRKHWITLLGVDARTIDKIQRIVAKVLGPFPRGVLTGRHGKGSTFRARGEDSFLANKLMYSDCTKRCQEFIIHWMCDDSEFLMELTQHFDTVEGSEVSFVFKDSFIDRIIAFEPTWNMWVQELLGDEIAARLAKVVEIFIKKGEHTLTTEKHGELARLASLATLLIATLDFSSASDLWAALLVSRLLEQADPLWREALFASRSPKIKIDDQWFTLAKYATMGNATTFPLETLLFYATARAVVGDEGIVSCYGDDLIVPAKDAEAVRSVFEKFGHKVNVEKSFTTGLFFESCGFDYFNGSRIFKSKLTSYKGVPYDAYSIRLHNVFWRLGVADTDQGICDVPAAAACNRIRGKHPNPKRIPCVPMRYGDVGYHSGAEHWKVHTLHGIRYVEGTLYSPVATDISESTTFTRFTGKGKTEARISREHILTYALSGGSQYVAPRGASCKWNKVKLSVS
uniref:RNA-directed RNA polymerase n=1 Tax=Mella virus TaxID=2707242 RepID=A0A6H0DH15_9VIRU|nr:MAG: RNA-dependent RNA polymerase [Mella virus]